MDNTNKTGLGTEAGMSANFRFKRYKNIIMRTITSPYYIIFALAMVVLTYLIIVPIFEMVSSTVRVMPGDVRRIPGSAVGDFTWFFWIRTFFSELSANLIYRPLVNTIIIGLSVGSFSVAFGSVMAWLMARSDLPGKRFFSVVLLIPWMLPSWTIALSWMSIFRTGTRGGAPGFLSFFLGLQPPIWLAYGPVPIIVVLAISNFAFAYLFVSGALMSVNSEVEEMGEIVGASKLLMLRKITFPLVLPAIISGFILVFARAIGSFGAPALLGMRVNHHTISTMLFSSLRMRDNSTGFIISLLLITMVALTMYVNQRVIGIRKSYATIGGKGGRGNLIKLGRWKYPILVFLGTFCIFAVITPVVILFVDTFMLIPGVYTLSNFTLHYWIGVSDPLIGAGLPGIFRNSQFWQSFRTTMLLTLSAAAFGTIVGQTFGYVVSRGRGKLSGRTLEQFTFLPFMIPSISMGAMYLSMFAQPRLFIPSLYGTFALLVLISLVKNLPFSTRAGVSNMLQIGFELEEAASIKGAGFFRRFNKILLPLAKPGFLTGFMLIFVSVIRDLDLIILLITPGMTTLAYMVWQLMDAKYDAYANVIASVIFLIVFFVYIIAKRVGKVDLAAGIRGG